MNDNAFSDAVRPARRVILRLLMQPYSIGHEILLQNRRNPMAILSQEEFNALSIEQQCHAVIEAALICFRNWEENKRPQKWVRVWGWLIRKCNFPLAIAEFRIYRAEGSTWPNITPPAEKEQGRPLGSPFLARLLAYSGSVFGNKAFDCELGLAQWMYFAAAEAEGNCTVENEIEAETRIQFAAMEAEILAERKAKEEQCPASS